MMTQEVADEIASLTPEVSGFLLTLEGGNVREQEIRTVLVSLLQVLQNTSDSTAIMIEALHKTLPGFTDALRLEEEKAQQRREEASSSRGPSSMDKASRSLADELAPLLGDANL
jgi:hypothetical protein